MPAKYNGSLRVKSYKFSDVRYGSDFPTTTVIASTIQADSDTTLNSEAYKKRMLEKEMRQKIRIND